MLGGNLWEVRRVFPSETERIREVFCFCDRSSDYDVYNIAGVGRVEVMGSDYIISYSVKGASGYACRKVENFSTKEAFY